MSTTARVEQAYRLAEARYAQLGVDTERAMRILGRVAVSIHCWQGDDVGGFESADGLSGGGIQATGNYPGKARTADELRADLSKALSLIPGRHRLALHAIYAETGGKSVDRDELEPRHFGNWMGWAKREKIGLDFNSSFFSHRLSADGFTLSHRDKAVRQFWVRHGQVCRVIGERFGKELGTPCVTNVWIPDGYKDIPADRKTPRELLRQSLDEVFAKKLNPRFHLDAVESKLFGIGSESYVVGSHEFYMGYAIENKTLLTLDAGHYHPTEGIADKISSVLLYLEAILLHVSRGVRWDSDHVVILSDDLRGMAEEIVRGGFMDRVHIGLDFFDASINRLAAYVIGARSMLKAMLIALLEPREMLKKAEASGDLTSRLAMMEELKTLPYGAVWDDYCLRKGVAVGGEWLAEVKRYERDVLSGR